MPKVLLVSTPFYRLQGSHYSGMKSSPSDIIYKISGGKQVSVLDICKVIMKIMKKHLPTKSNKVEDKTLVTNRTGSAEKAKRDLGLTAKVSLEDGLRQVVKWKVPEPNAD